MFSFIKKKLGWGTSEAETKDTKAPPASQAPAPDLPSPAALAPSPAPTAAPPTAPAPASAPSPVSPAEPATLTSAPRAPSPAPTDTARADARPVAPPEPASRPERRSWLDKLRHGLRKTGSSIAQVFTGTQIDDALYEELEAALLMADAGVAATEYLLKDLKRRVKDSKATDPSQVKALLIDAITDLLQPLEKSLEVGLHTPTVIMVAGVNGAGKTTTIGKLTRHLADANQRVLLAAADTFRAAAREQLLVWADRNRVDIVSQEGGDPAAVTFDAVQAGRSRGCDVVIADTAGRLATQLHLMEELRKIKRVISKAMDSAPHEVLLVVDGNTGQNALSQVKAFDDALGLTGLIVTKLDGTAKGGVLAAIALWSRERHAPVPVYFIGVGEKLEDLQTFSAREFAQALLS
ncbi:MAG: signal recognition particle-docking protein FtsY [Aquabacterium sp.]